MRLSRAAILALACILPFTAGCGHATPHRTLQPTGSIRGTVTFLGFHAKPAVVNPSTDPACAFLKHYWQFRIEDHMLPRSQPPAFLWISAGLNSTTLPTPHQQAVLTQIKCRFQPQFVGVLPNQPVDFTNSDPFPAYFRVSPRLAGNPTLNLTLRPEKTGQVRSFPHPELMIPVTSPKRPWMRAYINVVPNPFFTLSGPQGHFTLSNLPPGTYSLSAIRSGYPAKSQSVTVKPNTVTHISFTFAPSAPVSPQHLK